MKYRDRISSRKKSNFDRNFNTIAYTFSKAIKYAKVINRKNKNLLSDNHKRVGKIINCHLVIERLILRELHELKKPENSLNSLKKLTFAEKLNRLPKNKPYGILIPAIRELNKIRNTLAHCLQDDYDLNKFEIKEIKKTLLFLRYKKIEDSDLEQKIDFFTERAMLYFALRDPQVKSVFEKIKKEFPNFPIDSFL